jgi:ribonuclease T
MTMSQIADSIQIRNTTFKNRVIKGAMSEALANHEGQPNDLHIGLYEAWAKGGLGCAITGNVMVNIAAKNEPGVVAIETERDLAKLQQWAAVGKKYGMVQLIQLSHPGRQCPKGLNKETVAPSAVPFSPMLATMFGTPRELRHEEILDIIQRFATAGFNSQTDALLEIACIPIVYDQQGQFIPGPAFHAHINPFEGANLDRRSLDFIGIDPFNPMRVAMAEDERGALRRIFKSLNEVRKAQHCTHAVLVGHNAHFDLGFLQAAIARSGTKNQNPFHSFSVFDTVTLSAVMFGQTVLARACIQAGIEFDGKEAHSALYDTQKTAELFCYILNKLSPHLLDSLVTEP